MSVAAGAGGVFLPGPCGQLGRESIHADRTRCGGDAPVGRHGQYVAQAVTADGGAQLRVGSVDLVAGHPGCGNLRLHGAGYQGCRQSGFGRETPLLVAFRHCRSDRDLRPMIVVDTGRGR